MRYPLRTTVIVAMVVMMIIVMVEAMVIAMIRAMVVAMNCIVAVETQPVGSSSRVVTDAQGLI